MKVYAVVSRWENPSDLERQCSIEGICSTEEKAEKLRKKRLETLSYFSTIEIEIEPFDLDDFEFEDVPISGSLMRAVKEKVNEDS